MPSRAKLMTAAVFPEFGAGVEVESRPVPEPGPGQALVRVVSCGVGLTLEHVRLGRLGGTAPRVPGHEFAGRVVGVGSGVDPGWTGAAVTASFYLSCGRCRACLVHGGNRCARLAGYLGAALDGALAQYVAVPAGNLVPVPDGVPLAVAGVAADAVASSHHVVAGRCGVRPGDAVAVVGAGGGVGVHAVQVARAFGAEVVGIERDPGKRARLVADGLLTRPGAVREPCAPGRAEAEFDVVVDTVGTADTLAAGLAMLRPGGRLAVLGYTPGAALELDPTALVLAEAAVLGTRYATTAEIAASLELLRTGAVRPVVGAVFPLEQAAAALAAAREGSVFGRIVVAVDDD